MGSSRDPELLEMRVRISELSPNSKGVDLLVKVCRVSHEFAIIYIVSSQRYVFDELLIFL